ncbi:hypothetical protein LguiA_028422 [Lonicera macranthoides]
MLAATVKLDELAVAAMTLWMLWHSINKLIWEGKSLLEVIVVRQALCLLANGGVPTWGLMELIMWGNMNELFVGQNLQVGHLNAMWMRQFLKLQVELVMVLFYETIRGK